MEHFNPLYKDKKPGKKFITIGEVMLRLTPPNYEKIRMASNFEASYGGAEANIALALASGLIYAMMKDYKPMDIANFAVASSVLKHTIRGDANITDNATEIKNIMNQNFDIKR